MRGRTARGQSGRVWHYVEGPSCTAGSDHAILETNEARATSTLPLRGADSPGYPSVIPYLAVNDGVEALEFYEKAFGAKEMVRELAPDGKLIHGRIRIGDSIIMLSDVFPGSDTASPSSVGTTTVTLHLYSKDVDALWDRAVAAGAKVTMPLENQYLGGTVRSSAGPVRSPLVSLDAGQDECGREGLEATGGDGLVRAGRASRKRTPLRGRLIHGLQGPWHDGQRPPKPKPPGGTEAVATLLRDVRSGGGYHRGAESLPLGKGGAQTSSPVRP